MVVSTGAGRIYAGLPLAPGVGHRGQAEELDHRRPHRGGRAATRVRVAGFRLDRLPQPVRQPAARPVPQRRGGPWPSARGGGAVKLGLGPIPLHGTTRRHLVELAAAAVEGSFDSVWVAESRAQGVGGGIAAAAFLAQVVPIRVGALVDVGDYHPLHMAEDIAIADLTSEGKLEVLLRGGSDEHLEVLVAALSGAHLRLDGLEFHVPARLDANQP